MLVFRHGFRNVAYGNFFLNNSGGIRIKEGNKERLQAFEGVLIARKHGGVRETITVRKVSFGVGVERIFPIHAPVVDKIEVVRSGAVRRAKLYYLRALRGKAARLKERD